MFEWLNLRLGYRRRVTNGLDRLDNHAPAWLVIALSKLVPKSWENYF